MIKIVKNFIAETHIWKLKKLHRDFNFHTILCLGRSLFRSKTNLSIGIHFPFPLLYKNGSTFVLIA